MTSPAYGRYGYPLHHFPALNAKDRARLGAYSRVLALLALDAHPALIVWDQASTETALSDTRPLVHEATGAAAEAGRGSAKEALARMRAHAFSNQPATSTVTSLGKDSPTLRLGVFRDGLMPRPTAWPFSSRPCRPSVADHPRSQGSTGSRPGPSGLGWWP
ncbi:hypothetical protein GCM10010326_64850 [Streptomyces xanthochromogenes]|uniref:Uncharacterized protein n=1 Tax=Streptomyces xanthochromogenes TaxID=67384 RepID=A0ABQ3ALL1_9ACTN|nr:hypothetical protein GCM10010326_64850 [Streptomyces xanthochromogenes]